MVDEEQINEMSYVFFSDVLEELGHKLSYDAIVNYAGNSFCEKSWDMIMESNPMMIGEGKHMSSKQAQAFADFFSTARVVEAGSVDIPRAPAQGKE